MLSLSKVLLRSLSICQVITKKGTDTYDEIENTVMNFKAAIIKAGIDAFVVGGIAFFSSFSALGFQDVMDSAKIALISSGTMAGLAFFNEVREQLKKQK